MNYAQEIESFLNGEKAISNIARNLIDSAGKLGTEMDSLETDIQYLFDEGRITSKKIASINSGLQRETGRYSLESQGIAVKVGLKLGDADDISCYIVESKRDKKKDELLAAIAKFKAAVKNGEPQPVCIALQSDVNKIMLSMLPELVKAA